MLHSDGRTRRNNGETSDNLCQVKQSTRIAVRFRVDFTAQINEIESGVNAEISTALTPSFPRR